MKSIFSLILVLLFSVQSYAQDAYQQALESLKTELEFEMTSDSITIADHPAEKILERFEFCAESERLSFLKELNFGAIKQARSAELVTSYWPGKWYVDFMEWEFHSTGSAVAFENRLNREDHKRIQYCVNKGGMFWLRIDSKLYVFTSRAYFVTFHYEEIRAAILEGLNG